jgi:hypothetical protein
MPDNFIARWQKSTYSMGSGQCVEMAQLPGGDVAVRDSKNQTGPMLRFSASEWRIFVVGIKGAEFNFHR